MLDPPSASLASDAKGLGSGMTQADALGNVTAAHGRGAWCYGWGKSMAGHDLGWFGMAGMVVC